jgi:hypothetical protein
VLFTVAALVDTETPWAFSAIVTVHCEFAGKVAVAAVRMRVAVAWPLLALLAAKVVVPQPEVAGVTPLKVPKAYVGSTSEMESEVPPETNSRSTLEVKANATWEGAPAYGLLMVKLVPERAVATTAVEDSTWVAAMLEALAMVTAAVFAGDAQIFQPVACPVPSPAAASEVHAMVESPSTARPFGPEVP